MVKGEKSFDEAMAEVLADIIVSQWLNPSSGTYTQITDPQELDALCAMLERGGLAYGETTELVQ